MLQTLKRRILNFIEPLLSFCIGLPLFVIICIPYLVYRNIRLKPYNIEQGPYVWKNRDKLIQLIDQDKSLSRKERGYLMSIPYVLCLPLGQGCLFWDHVYINLAKCVKKYDWETRENCTEAVYAELKREWLTPEEIKRYEEHKKMRSGYTSRPETPQPAGQVSSSEKQTHTMREADLRKIFEGFGPDPFGSLPKKNINEDTANPQ